MSFAKSLRLNAQTLIWASIAALVVATMLPALLTTRTDAAQVTSRVITMASSAPDAETSYDISFVVPDNGVGENIGAFRVEFCDSDPLPHQTCTYDGVGDDIPQVDANAGSAASLSGGPFTFDGQTISMTAPSVGDRYLEFTLAATTDIAADTTFSVTVADIDNPDNSTDGGSGFHNNEFFARVYVYDSTTPGAIANPISATGVNNEGGIAMSTAEQITVEARVQEHLDFQVGTDATANDCATISGNTVDVGILDADGTLNRASLHGATNPANTDVICAEITTNASSGATISYLSTDLQVSGATCTEANGDIDSGTEVETDECINWEDTSPTVHAAGTEHWGIGIMDRIQTDAAGAGSLTLSNALYDRETWNDSVAMEPYATSAVALANTGGTVAAYQALKIDVGAEAAITTPTGLYEATLTFISTATF